MRTQGYLAFVCGLVVTAATCLLVLGEQDARMRGDFQRDADKVASDASVRLQTYFDMLLSIKGIFSVDENVDRAQFARFVGELNLAERYPGFQAIQFVRRVPASRLDAFAAGVRGDTSLEPAGYPAFEIHPRVARGEHYIIEYNEPMKGNENAFGLDLAALAPHLRAIEIGRDTGAVVATERITLVQDAQGSAGFVARAPIYRRGAPLGSVEQRRAALVGMVAIVFKVDHLMREVVDPALLGHMALRIHDAGSVSDGARLAAGPATMLFDTSGGRVDPAELATSARIKVGTREWEFNFSARPGSRYSGERGVVYLLGAAGVVVSALIAALVLASMRGRRLAAKLRLTIDEQRAFQDSAGVGIALFSAGTIMRCNRGMEEITGWPIGELTGQPSTLLWPDDSAGPFAHDAHIWRWQGELELTRKDGTPIWCLVNGKALDQSDLSRGGVWAIQDISDRKRTEAALVRARDGLEHSLFELEQQKVNVETAHQDLSSVLGTLKQAQTNLITSEKMASLGSLVAGIAHELNTPIGNSLLSATALADMVVEFERKYAEGGIKRSALDALLADARTACGIIANSLRRAADLITSFKQVAVDQASDQRRKFDLCDVVRDTLATYAAQLRRANCEARVDAPAALMLDSYPGSVGQVLSNLINNALLHAFEGRAAGVIAISAREQPDGQVALVFRDDGVGMGPKILHHVFDPFFTTKMGQGGSGLGMNIVYNIVTGMLGGSIEVESTPDKGTSVTLRLPRSAPKRDAEGMELALLVR
ncbi:CHASE domain-containing protein [Massilia glaciei]|uniref:histidine kinase n=1 Tax=Massilia glaciei TaxID=1524097 RepID=A0A2U2I6U6_9BURK|nr:CHASE domain-containing protein [Massilia glaciei]PWF55476.1 PAS domain S-box protein [Massilia glaciei]